MRIKLRAHGRVDAVGGDQQIGVYDRDLLVRAACDEACAHFAFRQLLDRSEMVAGPNPCFGEPLPSRAEQDHLQIAAMDRQLRPGIARRKPARLAPDFLPELVEIDELACRNRSLGQRIEQPALAQYLGRVRRNLR